MADLVGKTLKNRYKVVESLGRGGMADVYKVWDEERAVYLAMKVLRQDLAQDPIFLRRFQREAKALAGLQHPHIVRFYGLERDDLLAFLLMEYVDGVSLQGEILRSEEKPLPMEHIQEVMQAVCSALHYAHHQGLVHCDIKPGNILIDKHGQIYLTDFGIARGLDAATSTMVGIGTPAYMAPELIKGEDPTPQTDIYALGIVLYEMLTGGERPFTGERAEITGTTAEKVRWEHLQLEPTPISQFNPNVNSNLQTVVDRCLQKQPEMRFQNVQDLLNSVNNLREGSDRQFQYTKTNHEKNVEEDLVSLEPDEIEKDERDVNSESSSDRSLFINGNEYKRTETKTKTREKKNQSTVIVVTLLVGILFLIGIPVAINNNNVHATQTAQAVATKNARATATAVFEATVTAEYFRTISNSFNTEFVERSIENEPWELIVDQSDDYLECSYLSSEIQNFIFELSVKNPSNISEGFDYQIMFRDQGGNDQYRLRIFSNGEWDLQNRIGDTSDWIISGNTDAFNQEVGTSNTTRLVAYGDLGYFYINGRFISELDLSNRDDDGSIKICTGDSGTTGTVIEIISFYLREITN